MDKVYVVKRSESDIIYAGTDKKAAEDISQRLDNDQGLRMTVWMGTKTLEEYTRFGGEWKLIFNLKLALKLEISDLEEKLKGLKDTLALITQEDNSEEDDQEVVT